MRKEFDISDPVQLREFKDLIDNLHSVADDDYIIRTPDRETNPYLKTVEYNRDYRWTEDERQENRAIKKMMAIHKSWSDAGF